jgi:VAD1 Analog of StAR-related lipid transfer domain
MAIYFVTVNRRFAHFDFILHCCCSILLTTKQLSGIPYADYFTVHSLWSVTAADNDDSTASAPHDDDNAVNSVSSNSKLTIKLWVQFTTDTWLKGKVMLMLLHTHVLV